MITIDQRVVANAGDLGLSVEDMVGESNRLPSVCCATFKEPTKTQ